MSTLLRVADPRAIEFIQPVILYKGIVITREKANVTDRSSSACVLLLTMKIRR